MEHLEVILSNLCNACRLWKYNIGDMCFFYFVCFLPDKKEITYANLFTEIKNWCPEWNLQSIKMDCEIAALKAV